MRTHLLDLVWAWGTLRQAGASQHAQRVEARLGELLNGHASWDRMERCWRMSAEPRSEQELLQELVGRVPEELITWTPDDAWFPLLRVLQELLLQRLAMQGVCVEANPTSNVLIGNYTRYGSLPFVRIVEAGVPVSLNTDNPGLLATTLPAEYEHLLRDGLGFPRARLIEWLARRREDAARASFLRGTPGGQAALEQLTSGLPRLFHRAT